MCRLPEPEGGSGMDSSGMNRRHFLKVTGAGAAAASTGIEGILPAGRAPASALQRRITAAVQSGAGADILCCVA